MLDMIKQYLLPQAAREEGLQSWGAARANATKDAGERGRSAQEAFGRLLDPAGPAATRRSERDEPPPKAQDERPELGAGWDSADSSQDDDLAQYTDPTLAGSAGEAQPQPQDSADAAESAADAPAPADTDQAAQPAASAQPVAAGAQAQTDEQPAPQAPSLPNVLMEALQAENPAIDTIPSPQTAEDAAAPERPSGQDALPENLSSGGGAPALASTEARDPAVVQTSSVSPTEAAGQPIEMRAGAVPAGAAGGAQRPAERPAEVPAVPAPLHSSERPPLRRQDAPQPEATGEAVVLQVPGVELAPSSNQAGNTSDGVATTAAMQVSAPRAVDVSAGTRTAPAVAPDPAPQEAPLPAPDLDHLAGRTVRWQRLGLLDGTSSARIRLEPPELGSVQVDLRTVGSAVRVQLTVEAEGVRSLLASQTDRLAQALQSHGLSATQIDVVVRSRTPDRPDAGDWQGGRGDGQGQPQQQPSGRQGGFQRQMQERELQENELNAVG